MARRGSFTAPGTRVSKTQDSKSEWLTYTIQAMVGAVACDVILLGLIVILITVGWPILFITSLFLAYYGTLAIIKLYENYTGNILSYQQSMKLAYAFVFSIAASDFFFIDGWWTWLIAKEMVMILVLETLSPLNLPAWVYFGLVALWFFGALKKWGKITLVFIVSCLTIWVWSQINYDSVDFDVIWSRLRYVMATLVIPWMLFGFILVISMTKEMIAPNLNFILETIPWSDYKQAGGIYGLLFPKLVEWKEQISNRVQYNIAVMGRKKSSGKPTSQKRQHLLAPASDSCGLAKYARAIFDGRATFSEKGTRDKNKKGATSFGYTQSEYRELRETMKKLELLDQKGNNYTLNKLGVETLQSIIDRTPLP
jgi:hypothetical protein